MAIYIGENAFITMTLSAIETSIKYEAAGILLGYQMEDVYFLENAISYQIAERKPNSVEISSDSRRIIRRVFGNYMKYRIIGEFHTHPEGYIDLSDEDKAYIRANGYNLEIVAAVEKTRSNYPWDYKKGVLSGSIDNYLITLAGWKVKRNKATKQTIRCPYAVGFDFSKPFGFVPQRKRRS